MLMLSIQSLHGFKHFLLLVLLLYPEVHTVDGAQRPVSQLVVLCTMKRHPACS